MAGQDSRIGDRSTASMRIKLKYPDVETFIQKYAVNISRGGIFIATKSPKPVGTYVKFEFLLSDAGTSSIIRGEGQVQWTKEFDPKYPAKAHGMGVKFMRLDADSQRVIDRALKWRAEHGTNPNVPLPVPTSSAHTISTPTAPPREEAPPPRPQRRELPPEEPPREEPALLGESTLPDTPPLRDEPPPAELSRPITLPPEAPTAVVPLPEMRGEIRGETRPISVEDREDEPRPMGRAPNEHTRPLPISAHGTGRPGDEIDALASEWGLSEEKLSRILKRARPRMVEATAELERLLLKPPKLPVPSKAEALQQLPALLAKKNGKNGTH